MTSESDTATRFFFPIGMRVKAANKKFRSYGLEYCSAIPNQRWLYTHTAGHTAALHSHLVTAEARRRRSGARGARLLDAPAPFSYRIERDPRSGESALVIDGQKHRFRIKRKPRAANDTPYWIMQVPSELIPRHSTIFTADTLAVIEAVFAFSGALQTDAATTVVREDGIEPVVVVPRPDGSALFLDRSRGVYAVRPDSARPVFLSCLGESLDPDDAIGFHVSGDLAYAALVRGDGGPSAACRTEVYEFEVQSDGYRQRGPIRLAGPLCFRAAAFDLPRKRVFLSAEEEGRTGIWVADLTQTSAKPVRLFDLPAALPATVLDFDDSGQRLFAAQGQSGQLWVADLSAGAPRLRLLADALGWPSALGFGSRAQRLYVGDLEGRRLWTLDCSDRCGEPEVFLHTAALGSPSTMEVGPDGTLWLGGLEAQMLMAVSPEGQILRTIHSFSGAPLPAPEPLHETVGEFDRFR